MSQDSPGGQNQQDIGYRYRYIYRERDVPGYAGLCDSTTETGTKLDRILILHSDDIWNFIFFWPAFVFFKNLLEKRIEGQHNMKDKKQGETVIRLTRK